MTWLASLRERFLIFSVSRLGALLILLLGATWRLRWVGHENVQSAREKGQNIIYTFWHGHMLALCYTHRRKRVSIMVSEHRDGEFIAQTVRLLGFVPVRGSTTRGGLRALFQMADRASSGFDVAITPDGPRGPRWRVQLGVITLAQRTGMPIIPVANGASSKKNLSSWDRYLIPLPFSRVVVLFGKSIFVPRELSPGDVERKRLEVERAMTALALRAESYFPSSG
jgi:lysophospholipid acyltransferase (LPLAT)-like uncharacterized protein